MARKPNDVGDVAAIAFWEKVTTNDDGVKKIDTEGMEDFEKECAEVVGEPTEAKKLEEVAEEVQLTGKQMAEVMAEVKEKREADFVAVVEEDTVPIDVTMTTISSNNGVISTTKTVTPFKFPKKDIVKPVNEAAAKINEQINEYVNTPLNVEKTSDNHPTPEENHPKKSVTIIKPEKKPSEGIPPPPSDNVKTPEALKTDIMGDIIPPDPPVKVVEVQSPVTKEPKDIPVKKEFPKRETAPKQETTQDNMFKVVKRILEISALDKSIQTKDDKVELSELKTKYAADVVTQAEMLTGKMDMSVEDVASVDIGLFKTKLADISASVPKVIPEMSPKDIVIALSKLYVVSQELGQWQSILKLYWKEYKNYVATRHEIWGLISFQSNEGGRKGDANLHMPEIVATYNELDALDASFNTLNSSVKDLCTICRSIIEGIKLQISLCNYTSDAEDAENLNF